MAKKDSEGVDEGPSSIVVEKAEAELPPPIAPDEELPPKEELPPGKPQLKGKVPLQPAVIRLTFRVPGEVLAYRTGWDGWRLSEEDLADIVEVYEALGIETDVRLQAIVIPFVCYGEKLIGYQLWKRAGKPGSTKEEFIGSSPPEGRR